MWCRGSTLRNSITCHMAKLGKRLSQSFHLLLLLLSACILLLDQTTALSPRPTFLLRSTQHEISSDIPPSIGPVRQLQRPFRKVSKESLRKDLISQCSERWRNATLDHFSRVPPADHLTTFSQRFFVCANHWRPRGPDGTSGPIFFYLGNEADVTLYLNNTGLMWESAPDFEAMLVFAEHRYYGESIPYGKDVRKHMGYLMAEQAMADYADLIMEIKAEYDAESSSVIGFGGSYGGMLATWMRLKYPHVLDGSIAASAPIWNFFGETPPFFSGSFAKGVTYDTSEMAGSATACTGNVRATWDLLRIYGRDSQGRAFLGEGLQLCKDAIPKSEEEVLLLREWVAAAWDMMAMGNFPYPSSYITNGHGHLPAFPVRVACSYLDEESPSDEDLLEAMRQAVGVFYNHTGGLSCFDPWGGTDPDSDHDADFWDFQWCAEMLMPFSKNGVDDMFWEEPFSLEGAEKGCQEHWGVRPRPLWAQTEWGGRRIAAGSNIVFSNGLLDPWHGGGVLEDVSDSMPSVIIPEGAHHLDLMFSHPDDPLSVIEVRKFQLDAIRDWIQKPFQKSRLNRDPKQQEQQVVKGDEHRLLDVSVQTLSDGVVHEGGNCNRRCDCDGGRMWQLWQAIRDWVVRVVAWSGSGRTTSYVQSMTTTATTGGGVKQDGSATGYDEHLQSVGSSGRRGGEGQERSLSSGSMR